MNTGKIKLGIIVSLFVSVTVWAACGDHTSPDDEADGGAPISTDTQSDTQDDDSLSVDDLHYADSCPELADCTVQNCQDSDPSSLYAVLQCTQINCPSEYEACFSFGEGTCKQILFCIQRCIEKGPLTDECQMECITGSTPDANNEFWEFSLCVEEKCPDAMANPLNNIDCYMNDCRQSVDICCGGDVTLCM